MVYILSRSIPFFSRTNSGFSLLLTSFFLSFLKIFFIFYLVSSLFFLQHFIEEKYCVLFRLTFVRPIHYNNRNPERAFSCPDFGAAGAKFDSCVTIKEVNV